MVNKDHLNDSSTSSNHNKRKLPSSEIATSQQQEKKKRIITTPTTNQETIKLIPKIVLPYAPVRQDERRHYLSMLHKQYVNSNFQTPIKLSVEKEFEICKKTKNRMEYMNDIKKLLYQISKTDGATSSSNTEKSSKIDSDNVIEKLKKLCIPKERLVKHGYITEIPEHIDSLDDFVDCSHCGLKFSKEREYSKIRRESTSKTYCKFHPGKLLTKLNSNLKTYSRTYSERYYSCCNESKSTASEGCKSLPYHVFKVSKPEELHFVSPFKHIPNNKDLPESKAIGLDCEMCFTNLGLEVMKVSVVDFETNKLIIDEIVKPVGDLIIDLNSDISGVTEIPSSSKTFKEIINLITRITNDRTIVVGHGLENDLNILRLIYDNIIDTAILFSENQVNPMRKDSLKKLAWKHLSKNIQGREHDSLEDAIVPIQIVKKNLK